MKGFLSFHIQSIKFSYLFYFQVPLNLNYFSFCFFTIIALAQFNIITGLEYVHSSLLGFSFL